MEIDRLVAAEAGWPKTKYAQLERERRWLCQHLPHDRVSRSSAISDLYLSNTQLRLREVRDLMTGTIQLKLGRKADISPSTRMITTIYLTQSEFSLLATLPGSRIEKTHHSIVSDDGVIILFDEFDGSLAGLIIAEVEFGCDADMNNYKPPEYFGREVTDDRRYSGGELATVGLPLA